MKWRQTLEVVCSGQPRAYADTEYVARVTFEHTNFRDPETFVPHYMDEEDALRRLKHVEGFVERKRGEKREGEGEMDAAFAPYLDYVKPFDVPVTADKLIEGGDPRQSLASVWEFRIVTRFTD